MRKTITLLLLALLTSVGAWAEDVYTVLYGVAVYTGEKITGVTPQTDFTASDGTTASDVVHSDANGDNCTNAMPIGGSTLYSGTSFTKSFPKAATKGVVHFEANYTATTNGQETWKIVDSEGVEIFGTTDCGYSNGNATKIWGFCNGESLGTNWFRQARSTHNRVVLDINLSSKVVSYTVLVSSGNNSYTTLTGTYNLPSGVSDVAGLTATKQNYYSYMDNVSLYNVYDDAVTEVSYTINYVYDNNVISISNGSMAAGETVNAENPITINNVKYYAADGATTSLTVSDDADKNVLNVNLRLPNTFNYTVNAVDGSNNVLATLASGSYTEGDAAISLAYPRYILSGTTIYASGTGTASYSTSFTPNADNYIKTIAYNSGTVNDVVYYTEGESVSGVSEATNSDRASLCKMGYTGGSENYIDVTTVEPGKYKIYMRGQNGNNTARAFNFKVGDEVVFTGSIGKGTNVDFNSEDFNVLVNSTLSFASEGSSASGVDYFYLVRTGDAEETITVAEEGTSTYVTTAALDFSNVEGLTVLIATKETQGYVELSKVTQVPAGAPIIVKGVAGNYSVPVCDATTYSDNLTNKLSGSATASYTVEDGDNIYAIKKDKSEFRPVAEGVEIPAKKAYFKSIYPINADAGAKPYIIRGEEEDPTAVSTVEVVEAAKAKKFFNAAGQQVDENYKGFVITSAGKKIINK